MPVLSNRQIQSEDPWVILEQDAEFNADRGYQLISAANLEQYADDLSDQQHWGILVDGETDLALLARYFDSVSVIAVDFPVLRDGRGFSIARLLRAAGYRRELRAVGHITRDKLAFLERCGFNSVTLLEHEFDDSCTRAYTEISVNYQGCEDTPRAIYS